MTPQEKAKELINKFNHFHDTEKKEYILYQDPVESIRCALIAVDEIIKEYGTNYKVEVEGKYVSYWQEVKQEIENL